LVSGAAPLEAAGTDAGVLAAGAPGSREGPGWAQAVVVKLAANTAVTIALKRIGTPEPAQPPWPQARSLSLIGKFLQLRCS
jgi:hypothetical protein